MITNSMRNSCGRNFKCQHTTQGFLDVTLYIQVIKARIIFRPTLFIGGAVLVHHNAIHFHCCILQTLHFVVSGPDVDSKVQGSSISSTISKA